MTKLVRIVEESIDVDNFVDAHLPSDVHLVTYIKGEETIVDAVRAYTKVDIFDHFYDKLKGEATIQSIESGYGKIRPNLYGNIKEESGPDS